jgi:predicted nucleic acid-binding protein
VGVILDSSVIIAAERRGAHRAANLQTVTRRPGEIEIGLLIMTVAELIQGAYRAKTLGFGRLSWLRSRLYARVREQE